VELGGPNGPLTGGRVVVRQPGDGERRWWLKAHGGEVIADSDERREGWERLRWSEASPGCSFIGVGGWGGGGGAPLMAARYQKRGRQRRRWAIKDGKGERAWSVARCGVAARGGWQRSSAGARKEKGGDRGSWAGPEAMAQGGGRLGQEASWAGQAGIG
jgi:hypothetical protein